MFHNQNLSMFIYRARRRSGISNVFTAPIQKFPSKSNWEEGCRKEKRGERANGCEDVKEAARDNLYMYVRRC